MATNLAAGAVTGEPNSLGIDWDHSTQQGTTKAAGWLRELKIEGEKILARIEWTAAGRESIESGSYRYFSPTFATHYRDDQGRDLGDTLVGGALTNVPFQRTRGVTTVALSALEAASLERQVAALTARPLEAPAGRPRRPRTSPRLTGRGRSRRAMAAMLTSRATRSASTRAAPSLTRPSGASSPRPAGPTMRSRLTR